MDIKCFVQLHLWVPIIAQPVEEDPSRTLYPKKIGIAIEEAGEFLYCMELLVESGIAPGEKIVELMREGNELVAILTASSKTARARLANRKG